MDKNKGKNLEGYPHYPASEDITRAGNNNGQENFDKDDNMQSGEDASADLDDDLSIVPGTEADVTPEDIRSLNAAGQNMNTSDSSNLIYSSLDDVDEDGDPLNEDSSILDDMTGESLDVPGSSADDADERVGDEDEENNYYSLGGDLHESQEENKGD